MKLHFYGAIQVTNVIWSETPRGGGLRPEEYQYVPICGSHEEVEEQKRPRGHLAVAQQ